MAKLDILGFGTYKLTGDICYESVLHALKTGYKTIDTATLYKNHVEVGRAIKDSGIPRNEIFITSKIHKKYIRKCKIADAISDILIELNVEYVDMLLLHEPYKHIDAAVADERNRFIWKQMEEIHASGKARYIGISNYNLREMKNIIDTCTIKPYVNQIEISPFVTRSALVNYCREVGVIIQAYRSLINGTKMENAIFMEIGEKHKISVAQLLLYWAIKKGYRVIPCSPNIDHITENYKTVDIIDTNIDISPMENMNENLFTLPQHAD
jgi:diketogulonate reductase-like aldo/keto reductase